MTWLASTVEPMGDGVSYGSPALWVSLMALAVSIAAAVLPYYRRPKLSLREDDRGESRIEGNGLPYLRALVHNKKGKRSAKRARVVLDGYRRIGSHEFTRLASPFLAWPSVFGQESDSYVEVIFPDASRPVGIGRFMRVKLDDEGKLVRGLTAGPTAVVIHHPDDADAIWYLHLELASGWTIVDGRDWLDPGEWTLCLLVGADDGDAHAFELDLAWEGDEPNGDALLSYVLDHLGVRTP